MQFTAAQIAILVGGTIEGDASSTVDSFGKIEEAKKNQLAFLGNSKYEEYLYTTQASIIIVNQSQQLKHAVTATIIRVPEAYSAFATLLQQYQQMMQQQLKGIQQPSFIHETAKLGENVFVGAFTYISENVQIGNNVKIFPGVFLGNNVIVNDNVVLNGGVKIYYGCVVGKNVTIHAGSVIGADGFGYVPQQDGTYKKIPQIGNVVIEENVEVGANTTIDRATMGSTIIRTGVKLDNLVQVAHNVEVGTNTVIAAQCGISGSTKIGKNVQMGGQAGFAGHLHIADGTKINGQSGITKSIKTPNTIVTGTPADEYVTVLRGVSASRNLPALEKRVAELEKLVQQLLQEKVNV